jgi:hypothetical protein
MNKKYVHVDPDFYEMFRTEIDKKTHSKIHYFSQKQGLAEVRGMMDKIVTDSEKNEFLTTKNGEKIRLDRIIAVNGKPGPAYDEYDNFANACLDCMGGMED